MKIDLKKGDVIYTGRFKNKKQTIKSFGKDDKGQPTVNGRKVLTFRVAKFMKENQELREQIRKIILQEYSGPNFMEPLLDKMEEFDKIMNDIHGQIIKNKFLKTTVDRDFKYIEKFMDKAHKYMKLAKKAVDDVTS